MKTLISALCLLAAFPARAEPFDMFRDCDECPEMIELPLGGVMMGQRDGEFRHKFHMTMEGFVPVTPEDLPLRPSELPLHRVTIDIPFALGRNEVTFAEWSACVSDGGCGGYHPPRQIGSRSYRDGHPVTSINYADALAYIEWLNSKTDDGIYRLPTDAEWEYAARAGTITRFAQGENLTSNQANFSAKATEDVMGIERLDLLDRGFLVEVHQLDAANPWGLRHMSGNIPEFTASCYSTQYAGWATSTEYFEHRRIDEECQPSVRGGGYFLPMDSARPASRVRDAAPKLRGNFIGFRVLKELPPNP